MGYTHYFTQNRSITDSEWALLCTNIREVINAVSDSIPVQFEYDTNEPAMLDDHMIRFNGVEDDGHETFILEREGAGFSFCKTARKPYDTVVTASLLIAQKVAPGAWDVSSDGDSDDWHGLELATQVIGLNFAAEFKSAHPGENIDDDIPLLGEAPFVGGKVIFTSTSVFNDASIKTEDGGMAVIHESNDASVTAEDDCVFVRLQSWDDTRAHPMFNSLFGKRIRITVEVED